MTTRLIIAYSLIGAMVLAAAAIAWWTLYISRERTEARRRLTRREMSERLRDGNTISGASDRG
jgi:hypothetical protein